MHPAHTTCCGKCGSHLKDGLARCPSCNQRTGASPLKLLLGLLGGLFLLGLGALVLIGGVYALISGLRM
jgi:hypothetical protein